MIHLARDVYETFVLSLSPPLRPAARELPVRVGAVPPVPPRGGSRDGALDSGQSWTDVLTHVAMWATPLALVEGLSAGKCSADDVRRAVLAHELAVLVATARDRVDTGALTQDLTLETVLELARRARDQALAQLLRSQGDSPPPYVGAARETTRAMHKCRQLLERREVVGVAAYEALSLSKWAIAFPAPLALVRAAHGAALVPPVRHALSSLWLAMQVLEDVLGWERAFVSGTAWPVLLGCPGGPRDPAVVRSEVHASGVVLSLLTLARARLEDAAEAWRDLGMLQLSLFAMNRASYVRKLLDAEQHSAGGAVRAHTLASWAARVL